MEGFKCALLLEKNAISPCLQDIFYEIKSSDTYKGIFPETVKLLNIIMSLPVGTATVERSFSEMKLIKTRLRSGLSNSNLEHLMKVAIEGPPLRDVDFNAIMDIFKQKK